MKTPKHNASPPTNLFPFGSRPTSARTPPNMNPPVASTHSNVDFTVPDSGYRGSEHHLRKISFITFHSLLETTSAAHNIVSIFATTQISVNFLLFAHRHGRPVIGRFTATSIISRPYAPTTVPNSRRTSDWAAGRVGLAFIPPGEPWRNGHIESFNGRGRDECLNLNVFVVPGPSPRRYR